MLTGDTVLRALRLGLHVSFAVLLGIGVVRMLTSGASPELTWSGLLLTGLLAVVYLAGTVAEKRATQSGSYGQGLTRGRLPQLWLGIVTLLWGLLVLLHADFSWVAFPLFFLHIHLLRLGTAIGSISLITVAVVLAQWHDRGQIDVATAVGPAIGAGFAVLMAMAYQALHAENRTLQQALDELHHTREELAVSQREAGALTERERLAREIHDTLAQGLSSIVLVARAAENSLQNAEHDLARERLSTVRLTASENLTEARRFVRALNTGEADHEPLLESLRRACESVERQAAARGQGLRCRLQINGEPCPLHPSQVVTLLRTAQSSLSNVALHARASVAVVTLSFLDSEILLDIFDDGDGFRLEEMTADAAGREDGSGFGLSSMRERVEALGGRLTVESDPGEGTVVAVRLPLTPLLAGSNSSPDSPSGPPSDPDSPSDPSTGSAEGRTHG